MVYCPYCEERARLIDSAEIFGRSFGMIWSCLPCGAWVGVHKNDGRNRPLGTLANAELRHARAMAHARFDPLWQAKLGRGRSKNAVRGRAYAWLAEQLGVPVKECHIGQFDLATCVKVIEICSREATSSAQPQEVASE